MEGTVQGEAFPSFICCNKLSTQTFFLFLKKLDVKKSEHLLAQDVKANHLKKRKTNLLIVKFNRQTATLLISEDDDTRFSLPAADKQCC